MLRRLAAMSVIVTALAGFGAPTAYAGKASPKPACCKPSHCLSQSVQVSKNLSCCRADRPAQAPTTAPATPKALDNMGPLTTLEVVLVSNPQVFRNDQSGKVFHSPPPPLFDLKSSFLI
ncbi:MAG TPA: hypothetical protein VLJ37_07115 [bacterium]|nr:hypothetical protein [bacterium]